MFKSFLRLRQEVGWNMSYCTFDLKYVVGHGKNSNDILMRSKTPSLTEMKRICAWKFVRSLDIGRVTSGRKYLKLTVSLIKMTSFSLKLFKNSVTKPM